MLGYLPLTPTFNQYQGPYKVGSATFEIPVSEISTPNPLPHNSVKTIKARVFYPTPDPGSARVNPIWWLEEPQSESLFAFSRFLGASQTLAQAVA